MVAGKKAESQEQKVGSINKKTEPLWHDMQIKCLLIKSHCSVRCQLQSKVCQVMSSTSIEPILENGILHDQHFRMGREKET